MAAIVPTDFRIWDDRSGNHFCVAKITYDPTLTTHVITLPFGIVSAAVLVPTSGHTAAAATIAQTATGSTVSLDNAGTAGVVYVVSRHVGNAANAR